LILDVIKDIERNTSILIKDKVSILFSPDSTTTAADNYYLQGKDNKSMTTISCDRPKSIFFPLLCLLTFL